MGEKGERSAVKFYWTDQCLVQMKFGRPLMITAFSPRAQSLAPQSHVYPGYTPNPPANALLGSAVGHNISGSGGRLTLPPRGYSRSSGTNGSDVGAAGMGVGVGLGMGGMRSASRANVKNLACVFFGAVVTYVVSADDLDPSFWS